MVVSILHLKKYIVEETYEAGSSVSYVARQQVFWAKIKHSVKEIHGIIMRVYDLGG